LSQGTLDVSLRFTFGDGVALVVLAAAAGDSDLNLGKAVLEVESQRYQSQAFLLDLAR